MTLFIVEYVDIMTGLKGYAQVRADTKAQAIAHIESKYADYEVIK
jgi:hypothetical protein